MYYKICISDIMNRRSDRCLYKYLFSLPYRSHVSILVSVFPQNSVHLPVHPLAPDYQPLLHWPENKQSEFRFLVARKKIFFPD